MEKITPQIAPRKLFASGVIPPRVPRETPVLTIPRAEVALFVLLTDAAKARHARYLGADASPVAA